MFYATRSTPSLSWVIKRNRRQKRVYKPPANLHARGFGDKTHQSIRPRTDANILIINKKVIIKTKTMIGN